MNNWIKQGLDYEFDELRQNLKMIALKDKEEEWKRDHYRHTVAVAVQRIFRLLNSTITSEPPAPVSHATKEELMILRDMIDRMVK